MNKKLLVYTAAIMVFYISWVGCVTKEKTSPSPSSEELIRIAVLRHHVNSWLVHSRSPRNPYKVFIIETHSKYENDCLRNLCGDGVWVVVGTNCMTLGDRGTVLYGHSGERAVLFSARIESITSKEARAKCSAVTSNTGAEMLEYWLVAYKDRWNILKVMNAGYASNISGFAQVLSLLDL